MLTFAKLLSLFRGKESARMVPDAEVAQRNRQLRIERKPCPVCGEHPFGDEYCCGHVPGGPGEDDMEQARRR